MKESLFSFVDPTEKAVGEFLEQQGVDVSGWGKDGAKSLGHLLRELKTGESRLFVEELEGGNSVVVRKVIGAGVNVYYKNLILVESEQVFGNGTRRVRNLPTSLGEKMGPGENPYRACARSLEEELKIMLPSGVWDNPIMVERDMVSSPSFPGLKSQHTVYQIDYYMTDSEFDPEGYVEVQSDKTTRWKWLKS